jgi:hypothetical protein
MNDDDFVTHQADFNPLHAINKSEDVFDSQKHLVNFNDDGQINRRLLFGKIIITVTLIVLVILAFIFLVFGDK